MKITDVAGVDFLTLGRVHFNLDDIGLVLIQGVNEDDPSAVSNGSGKSSLPDLISWVLWGETARGLSGDDVIRTDTKQARGEIILTDEVTDETWLITRVRKKGKEILTVEHTLDPKGIGGITDITLGTIRLTQEMIAKIVGCSQEVFNAGIIIGQEKMVDLPAMTDKKLKELIEEAAGVNVLERAYEIARTRAKFVEKSKDAEIHNVGLLRTKLTSTDEMRVMLEAQIDEWSKDRAARHEKLMDHLTSLNEDSEKLTVELDEAETFEPRFQELFDDCNRQLESLKNDRTKQSTLQAVVADASRKEAAAAARLRNGIEHFKQERINLDDAKSTVGQACRECGSTMTEDHVAHSVEAITARLGTAKIEVSSRRDIWEACKASVSTAQEALDAHNLTMRDPSELIKLRDKFAKKLADIQGIRWKLENIEEDVEDTENEITEVLSAANPFLHRLTDTMAKIKELQDKIIAADGCIDTLIGDLAIAEQAVEVFSPKGVRAHILDQVTPFLNERTSEYLGVLSDGAITATWNTLQLNSKGEVKERFAIDVTHAHGGKSFAALSGGEKRKTRLACALALQDLIGSRATKPFRLWIGDEIDEALDEAGLERLMTIMHTKAAEKGTVLVISHNSLTSWIDTVWTVTKRGKSSILSVT